MMAAPVCTVAIVMLILLLIPILIFNRVQQRELEGRLT